jgi:hypothetical protein
MRIGDIDGYNEVYTPLGILIFETNEKLIKRLPDKEFWLYTQWRSWFTDMILIGIWGKGSLFITDRRIVFIRRPLDERKILKTFRGYQGGEGGMKLIADGMTHSRKVNEYGGFDFLEIRYEDIAFLKKGLLYRRLCILSNGKRYKTYLDRDVFQLILPFLVKRNIRIKWGRFKRGRKIPIPKSKS